MPAGSSFVALGRGNGFPFCLSTSAPPGTDWCRNLAVADAMSAWWLPYSIRLQLSWRSAFTDSAASPPVWIDSTQNLDLTAEYGSTTTVPVEPVGRVCLDVGDLSAATGTLPDPAILSLPESFAEASGSYGVLLRVVAGDQSQTYPEQFLDLSSSSADPTNVQDTIDVSTPYGTIRLYGTSDVGGGVAADVFELLSANITITDWTF